MQESRYPYVHVDLRAEEVDEVSAALFDLGATGIEEKASVKVDGMQMLSASFDTHEEALHACANLPSAWNPRLYEVIGDAWRDAWKEHFHPFVLCEGVVVCPPWEEYTLQQGEQLLWLEPGAAFGTGLHETTRLVAQVLAEQCAQGVPPSSLLDVGCGSGILALLALRLGIPHARGVDIDADAVRVAQENAERNELTAQVCFDTTSVHELDGSFPLVVANIESGTLVALASALRRCPLPGGLLVLSGILTFQKEQVLAAYPHFALLSTKEEGEWIALVLRAPGG